MTEITDAALAKDVAEKLPFILTKNLLVKPLPEEYVKKEISIPVATDLISEDGIKEFDTKSNIETVPAKYRKGIVLAIPVGYEWQDKDNHPEIGDMVCYPCRAGIYFDLFKDSQLVNPYNVEAFIKGEN